jgi:hypothetical protein
MKIDETKMKERPPVLQRVKHGILAGLWGLALSFVLMIFIPYLHFMSVYDHPLYMAYIATCIIFGGIYGEKFIETIAVKTDDWFDIKTFFRF